MIKMNIAHEGQMGIVCLQTGYSEKDTVCSLHYFWPRMNNQKLVTRKHETNCNIIFLLKKEEDISWLQSSKTQRCKIEKSHRNVKRRDTQTQSLTLHWIPCWREKYCKRTSLVQRRRLECDVRLQYRLMWNWLRLMTIPWLCNRGSLILVNAR